MYFGKKYDVTYQFFFLVFWNTYVFILIEKSGEIFFILYYYIDRSRIWIINKNFNINKMIFF